MAYKGYAEEDEEEDVEELEEDEEEEEEPSRKRKKRASVYFDEAAEEDEEEEEEEETTMRKRRMRRASEFIDDTAAVASDEEEEEEDEGEDGFLDDRGADLQEEVTTNRMPRRNLLPEDDQQENVEDLENYIKQRYGGGHDYGEYEDGETTEVEQQALLPSIKDPKLWMVRCQVGHEREAAVCLMQKYLDLDTQGQPLLIKSAIALDHLKGLFYVESEKEAYVRQAIKGMRMIFQSKVTLVPIKEMTDVLSVEKKTIDIANNSWVRIKNGLYKGDLAKVMDVDHVKQKVKVLLIPRLDLQALAAKFQDDRDDRDKKKTLRPVPRFFNIDEIRDTRIPMERKRDSVTGELLDNFNGMQFKDGYLYKTVALKSVDTNVVPTFDELQKFQKPGEDGNVDALGLPSSLATKQRGKLMKGDAVVIIEGDLQNLMGTVEKVDEDTVYIRPKDVQLKDTIAVNETQVRKFFSTGEHVKVIRGAHLGSTGMVVKVERHSVVILNDTTKEHIQVFTSDVVESSEVTTGLSKLGDYELHDLVLLDQTTVGVIIRVEPDGCQILKGNPERSEVMTVKQRDMRKKIFDKRANAADGDMNMISLKDIVRVRNGPLKGRQGPVEHIHRGLLFIYDRHHLENGGFFCVHSRSCVALGGTRNGNERVKQLASSFSELSSPSRYLQSPRRTPVRDAYQPQNGFGGRHSFGGQGRRDEGLVGRTVKIRLGPFKGYRGRVKDATITTVRIELESQMKEVTVRRDQLSDIGDTPGGSSSFRESPRYGLGSETPLHPSRTPLHPAFMATPLRDPSATPIHEGMRTPMRDRAWNPHAPMTPLRDNSWDDSNPSTWGASSTQYQPLVGTPSGRPYEAPTPGAGWASTPGPSYSGVSTPSDSAGHSYGNAPSPFPGTPGGPPSTPGAPAFPGTPGQPMTPGTGGLDAASPASGISSHDTESKWGLPDVIVTVRAHGIGVIREVMPDASCKVTLSGDGETVIASHTEMELVLPKKTDRVKIVAGDLRGSTGKLIGVDGVDGIVKMDDTLDIKILDMGQLGKMPA